jgi:hypothetical protein
MTIRLRTRHVAALTLLLVTAVYATGAAAQWAWKEENGRVVYSDQPPPPNVKIQILRQPAGPAPETRSAGGADAGKAGADKGASSAPKTLAERDMEFRKRQQERADAERKAQEEQQKSSARAADCERARGYLKALEDGVRIAKTDASGNREYLDDAQRAAETERARKMVDSLCK